VWQATYLPYGQEWPGLGASGSPPPNHYKFTGKERDAESGLDYFGARYYSSSYGRFITPDWATAPTAVPYAEFGDPQSLNLYTYVGNNPITRFDTDGHCWPISECAAAVQNAVTAVTEIAFKATAERGFVGTAATIATVGEIVNGTVDAFRAGESIGACVDSCNGQQMADAVGQDLGRTAGLVGMAAAGGEAVLEKVTQRALTKAATEALDTVGPGKGGLGFPGFDKATTGSAQVQNGMVIGFTATWHVQGTSINEQIQTRYVTPIPQADFLQGKGLPAAAYPVSVEKQK